jgi:hypothetical protein
MQKHPWLQRFIKNDLDRGFFHDDKLWKMQWKIRRICIKKRFLRKYKAKLGGSSVRAKSDCIVVFM